MRMVRIASTILVLAATVAACVLLLRIIRIDHWGFAIGINFLFMLAFTIVFGVVLKPKYRCEYFDCRPFERDGSIYRRLGVTYFSTLLRWIGWERNLRKDLPIKKQLNSLKDFEIATRGSEAIHLFAAISAIAITIWAAIEFSLSHVRWLIPATILFNIYPVLLQRYNRPRVNRVIRRGERRTLRNQPTGDADQ